FGWNGGDSEHRGCRRAVHQPQRHLLVACKRLDLAPDQVGLPVAIQIRHLDHLLTEGGSGRQENPRYCCCKNDDRPDGACLRVAGAQIALAVTVEAADAHERPGRCVTFKPFMNQTETSPVCELRQTRSSLPSPSRSATPTICQVSGTFAATTGACFTVAPSINHAARSPVSVCRQTRSALPSPSTSPAVVAPDGKPGVLLALPAPFAATTGAASTMAP